MAPSSVLRPKPSEAADGELYRATFEGDGSELTFFFQCLLIPDRDAAVSVLLMANTVSYDVVIPEWNDLMDGITATDDANDTPGDDDTKDEGEDERDDEGAELTAEQPDPDDAARDAARAGHSEADSEAPFESWDDATGVER